MGTSDAARTTRIALLFEGGLGIVALVVGWLVGQWPLVGIHASDGNPAGQLSAVGWGLVATGPLVVALLAIDRFPIGPLAHLREMTSQVVLQMFGGASLVHLAAVSLAAGFGEELLFRGLVQSGLSRLIAGPFAVWIALAIGAVLFGLCHWLNTTYAILAMLAGAYFGFIFVMTENILTPIVAHGAYDFLALMYLVRPQRLIG